VWFTSKTSCGGKAVQPLMQIQSGLRTDVRRDWRRSDLEPPPAPVSGRYLSINWTGRSAMSLLRQPYLSWLLSGAGRKWADPRMKFMRPKKIRAL